MLEVRMGKRFRKDLEKARRRGLKMHKLDQVVLMLAREQSLPLKYRDHALTNGKEFQGVRECHLEPDWLLVYRVDSGALTLFLMRTGSHSDLF